MKDRTRKNKKQSPPYARWRAWLVLSGFALFLGGLGARAAYLQVMHQDFLAEQGAMRFERTVTVPAGRGALRDRNGEPLALSAPVESVWAVPSAVLDSRHDLDGLAQRLNMTVKELRKTLESHRDRQFLYLRRHMTPADARQVMALDVPGIFLQREYQRYYPAGEVAVQLVGLTDIDGNGQEGAELEFNKALDGTPGSRHVIKDRLGRVVDDLAGYQPAKPGRDVYLSIDMRLQYLTYRELKRAVGHERARAGIAIVLDAHTGEVLAMANQPSCNPNRRESITSACLRNRAVTDNFEPGSTIKPLVVSEALNSGMFHPGDTIDTGDGRFRVADMVVHDHHGYGVIDLATILQKSSNIGAAKIGLALGAKRLWTGFRDFGLGEITASGFPGESRGNLSYFFDWGKVKTATSSYGYGLAVTALQLARAYGALADGGVMHPVSLVRLDKPPIGHRILPHAVAAQVREYLEGVVTPEGTAGDAAIDGYDVAGKTGTVRKVVNGHYDRFKHRAIFVGMIPAENPRLVGIVVIDEPRGARYYGGLAAAPVFAGIMRGAARILQVAPDGDSERVVARVEAQGGNRS